MVLIQPNPVKDPVHHIYIYTDTSKHVSQVVQSMTRLLHLRRRAAIAEKSIVDGDGGATNADNTVLHAHPSDQVEADVSDGIDSQRRCQRSKRAVGCRNCQCQTRRR